MGIPFTLPMEFLLTVTMGFLLTIALAIQLTISRRRRFHRHPHIERLITAPTTVRKVTRI